MSWWKLCTILSLGLALGAAGCGSSAATPIVASISPTSASVIGNTTQQFAGLVTGSTDTAVTWSVTCATGVTACGTIDANGLYTAPKTIPSTPTATITVTSHADSTKTAKSTVTIISGISISIRPTTATVGTNETFTFTANVNNPGCDQTIAGNSCLAVNWSVPTTGAVGSINSNGVYTAPATAPATSVTITATSQADTTITATAIATVVTAADPTLTSISPKVAGQGSYFQDTYITGTNFISTNTVFVNGTPVSTSTVSTSVIRARVPDTLLALAGTLQVTVSRQNGTPQGCSPDPSQCQLIVAGVRPAVVGPSPDSIPQGSSGSLSFNVDGGFFGTSANPSVNAVYDGLPRLAQVSPSPLDARQLSVIIGGPSNPGDFGTAGLHQVDIRSNADVTKFAATNIAIQPDVAANPPTQIGASLAAGTAPSSIAVNPTTGVAVVANTASNDITLINVGASSPSVIAASICTAAVGAVAPCPASGPKSVAVDYVRNIALVANSTSNSVAVVDLVTHAVTAVIATPDSPVGIGINSCANPNVNPCTGRALVAMQTRNYGLLLDLTQATPTIAGVVSISTGPNSHVAVEPHLNWAVATPGGVGSLGIVDLNRQTVNNFASVSRSAGVVTATVQASTTSVPQAPLLVKSGDAVLVQNISDTSFNGIYTVAAVGPGNSQFTYTQVADSSHPDKALFSTGGTVNYASAIASLAITTSIQGIAINPETQQALLVDPTTGVVSFVSLIDQSVSSLVLRAGNGAAETASLGGAFNPLTNTAYIVNPVANTLSVIDPTTPQRLPTSSTSFPVPGGPSAVAVDPASNRLIVASQNANTVSIFSLGTNVQVTAITDSSPKSYVATSTLAAAPAPSAITLSVIGKGFTSSSIARLDGVNLATAFVTDRQLTAVVPPSLLSSARRFALDVQGASGPPSNASDFTVTQSIDVSACGPSPLPSGVAIDPQQNIAVVTLAGCNTVALMKLTDGTGQSVAVGANPAGVAVIPRLQRAAVANNGAGTVSIIDELGASVVQTVATGSGAIGVGADQDTGEVAVANSIANTVTIVNVSTFGANSISTGPTPIAVAFDYQTHQIAVAAASANVIDVALASGTTVSTTASVSLPTSVVYDPASNTFLAAASTGNSLVTIDPTTGAQSTFRIGINPTAVAYNYRTSTLVSTNTGSHTITVVDFLGRRIRAVLTLPPAPVNSTVALTGSLQFALDIHPLTNMAVIADTANGRVLFIPVPR